MTSLFIVGSARSGTTFLADRIRRSWDVAVAPETHYFSQLLRAHPELVRDDDVSAERLLDAARGVSALQGLKLSDQRFVEVFEAERAQVGAAPAGLTALCSALTADESTHWLGEKTPQHLRYWKVIAAMFPEALIVAVVRDPRAVAASRARTGWAATRPATVAAHWVSDTRLVSAAQTALGPRRMLTLRYEDAVRSPDSVDEQLDAFLKIGRRRPDDALTPLSADWETWKTDTRADPQPDRVDRWRESDKRSIDVVEMICWREMIEHGYEPLNHRRPRRALKPAELTELLQLARGEVSHARSARRLVRDVT